MLVNFNPHRDQYFLLVSKLVFYVIANVVGNVIPDPVYIYIYTSSSSCRAKGTDITNLLSPLLPIVHHLWQVFWTTSRILT